MRRRFVALLGLAVSVAMFPATSQATSFTGLGLLEGGTFGQARAVSDDGRVAVGFAGTAAPPSGLRDEAFRWTAGGGMVGLGFLSGSCLTVCSRADGVSADGSAVVGTSVSTSAPISGSQEAFRWTPSGGMVGLGFLPSGFSSNSQAQAVSADGSVVVGASTSLSGEQAFLWTSGGGMVGLGFLGSTGNLRSEAFDVSADGSVIVGQSISASGSSLEAFRWTASDGMVGLGLLPGVASGLSRADATSADGSVVVGSSASTSGLLEAFRWTESGGMVGLGISGTSSQAFDVSADGSVVVGYVSFLSGEVAAIWDSHGTRSLQQVLTSAGVDLTGWSLTEATGISADGKTIVGFGRNPLGQIEPWIATIPEPGAPLLLLAALLALAWRSRRPL